MSTRGAGAHATALDDLEARPGSATSVLRTIVGLYLRRVDGWMPTAALVRLSGGLGVEEPRTRTAIARAKQRGLLVAERRGRRAGYRLAAAAVPMLERGDRRIFSVRRMREGEPWCLVSFTLPEARRDVRHRLRVRLRWVGAGRVAPGLWIAPGHLEGEVTGILDDLGVRGDAVLLRAADPLVQGSLADAAATWWDLRALRTEHERFQASLVALPDAVDAASSFAAYVGLVDAWRVLPYVDPGLPASLLPADWPGEASFAAFEARSAALAPAAWEHVRAVTA